MIEYLETMGHFTAIGMRTAVPMNSIVVNTCAGNDTADPGDGYDWTWSNPTNRAIVHRYADVEAVSVECLWQGTKIRKGMTRPDAAVLCGAWRRGKAKRPVGAWAGEGQPLITSPGEARRRIYIPAFRRLIEHWLSVSPTVLERVERAKRDPRPVFLRDWDTGRGVDNDGPMSHAWVLASWLNTGMWPS